MKTHGHIEMLNESGERVRALAPMIVSASRATDIPAFLSSRFLDRRYK